MPSEDGWRRVPSQDRIKLMISCFSVLKLSYSIPKWCHSLYAASSGFNVRTLLQLLGLRSFRTSQSTLVQVTMMLSLSLGSYLDLCLYFVCRLGTQNISKGIKSPEVRSPYYGRIRFTRRHSIQYGPKNHPNPRLPKPYSAGIWLQSPGTTLYTNVTISCLFAS